MSFDLVSSTSNWFKVKDEEKFEEFMNGTTNPNYESKDGFVQIFDDGAGTGLPMCEDDSEFIPALAAHLVEGQVAVLQEAGFPNRGRGVFGAAVAVNHRGEWVNLTLEDIYAKAEEKFKITNLALQGEI